MMLAMFFIPIQDCVAQRAVGFFCRRMNELARGLIDDHEVVIFIADIKRQVLGLDI